MAQILARMERDGLIQRSPDPSDRHRSLVMLSEKAKRRLGRVLENVEQIESSASPRFGTSRLLIFEEVDGIRDANTCVTF